MGENTRFNYLKKMYEIFFFFFFFAFSHTRLNCFCDFFRKDCCWHRNNGCQIGTWC
ncbi:hypothetical protein HanPSC8_Chr13g0589511 [Helianthus annuus]|nr:hypothetical protein HanPSC8_Chr13g0589511 [Helianthus annuus]